MTERPLRILSLGAGVQSTTVLLMSLYGDLPPLDLAIFADTGWEPAAVYEHLDKLTAEAARHGLEIRRVSAGNIYDDHADPQGEHLFVRTPRKHKHLLGTLRMSIPFYVAGTDGSKGMTSRRCTVTYKVEPIERELRRVLGLEYRQRWPVDRVYIEQVFGISWDETIRMRDAKRPAVANVYPLVDQKITRNGCHAWMADHGWTAPRSACIGCPFHRNDEWRRLRDDSPAEFAQAVHFEETMQRHLADGRLAITGMPFLHDSRVALSEADIEQVDDPQGSLFGNECEGMCGV